MKRRTLSTLRYIAIVTFAFTIGMVLVLAFRTDAETDAQLQQIDVFIKTHSSKSVEAEPETVSLSYSEWKEEQTLATNLQLTCNQFETESETAVEVATEVVNDELLGNDLAQLAMTPEDFQQAGVIEWHGWKYTYYSEQVLPGGGLSIPGRWSDGQFVRDENGYLCVASNEVPYGEQIETPFGTAIVYDSIGDGVTGICDIYVSW